MQELRVFKVRIKDFELPISFRTVQNAVLRYTNAHYVTQKAIFNDFALLGFSICSKCVLRYTNVHYNAKSHNSTWWIAGYKLTTNVAFEGGKRREKLQEGTLV